MSDMIRSSIHPFMPGNSMTGFVRARIDDDVKVAASIVLEDIVKLIANDGRLEAVHCEHELSGVLAGFLECNMGGDVLLLYTSTDSKIVFTRAGSHAKLFEN